MPRRHYRSGRQQRSKKARLHRKQALFAGLPGCLEFEAAGRALALVHGIEVKRRGELEYKLVLAYPDEVLPLLAWEFEAYMKRLERAV